MARKPKTTPTVETNPDPITGEPGAHALGTGLGAALGGAAAGAAAGALGGPVGAVVGAIAGGVGGGLAGKAVAESANPTVEEAFWREAYGTRPYYEPGFGYEEDFGPAYRTGWEARAVYPESRWEDVEEDIEGHWEKTRGSSRLSWEKARQAARDAWDRASRPTPKKG